VRELRFPHFSFEIMKFHYKNNPFRITGKNCKDCGKSPVSSCDHSSTTRCGCGNMIISDLDSSLPQTEWFIELCNIAKKWNERFG
jgi:ABC-type ATPase with predicted acetyltransferase domain